MRPGCWFNSRSSPASAGHCPASTGRCLNAGCGEGLYSRFIEAFPAVTEIMNVDLGGTDRLLAGFPTPGTGGPTPA